MTNKEKAKQIAEVNKMTYLEMENDGSVYDVDSFSECEDSALDMAKWKDEQIKSLLPQIITCVYQGFTQCASDEVMIKELTNLINQK